MQGAHGELNEPLLGKTRGRPTRVITWLVAYSHSVMVAVLCMGISVLHPFASEGAKSARLTVCTAYPSGISCSGGAASGWAGGGQDAAELAMPFFPATLPIIAQCSSIVLAFLAEAAGCGSLARTVRRVLRPREALRVLPVGLVYSIGDLLQIVASNAASAPVVLVIGQCKLLITALLSALFLRTHAPRQQWSRLLVITCAAVAGAGGCAAQARTLEAQESELYGAMLALVKALVSSAGAVLAERSFRASCDESFFVMCIWLQMTMLATSLVILPLTGLSGALPAPSQFFSHGPGALCTADSSLPCDPSLLGGRCTCYDRLGWDHHTVLAVAAIVCNGLLTGLTLKHLSAVAKAACSTLSVAVFYVAYVCLGFQPFNLPQACAITIIIITSYEYVLEKVQFPARRHRGTCEVQDVQRCRV